MIQEKKSRDQTEIYFFVVKKEVIRLFLIKIQPENETSNGNFVIFFCLKISRTCWLLVALITKYFAVSSAKETLFQRFLIYI